MRILTAAFLFSFIFCIQLNAQETQYNTEFKAEYLVVYNPDSTQKDYQRTDLLWLFTGNQHSVFTSDNLVERERMREKRKQKFGFSNVISTAVDVQGGYFKSSFYKNLSDKEVFTVAELKTQFFGFKEPVLPEWQIEKETKEIDHYTVQKATTHFAGRDYIAWFTFDIPIPDGPYLFSGLPGLIIELYDSEDNYHFTMTSFEPLPETKIWELPSFQKTDKDEYKKLKLKADKNKQSLTQQVRATLPDGAIGRSIHLVQNKNGRYEQVSEAEYRKMMKKRDLPPVNNPLERD